MRGQLHALVAALTLVVVAVAGDADACRCAQQDLCAAAPGGGLVQRRDRRWRGAADRRRRFPARHGPSVVGFKRFGKPHGPLGVKAWKGHRYTLTGMNCGSEPRIQSQVMTLPESRHPATHRPVRTVCDELANSTHADDDALRKAAADPVQIASLGKSSDAAGCTGPGTTFVARMTAGEAVVFVRGGCGGSNGASSGGALVAPSTSRPTKAPNPTENAVHTPEASISAQFGNGVS